MLFPRTTNLDIATARGAASPLRRSALSRAGSLVLRQRHMDIALDVLDRTSRGRHDVEIEYFCRQPQGRTGVGHVDNAGDVALARSRSQDRIGLRAGIAELLQVLDRVQAGLPVGDMHIEVVLPALLVDRDTLE